MRRVTWMLLLAFSFTIPWEYSLDLGAPLGSIARVLGLALLLAFVPAVLQAGRMRAPGPVQWLVLSLFLWSCCSYFWTIDSPATLERVRGLVQVMMIAWLVWELTETPEDLRNLMRTFVAGCWVLAALTILNFAWPHSAGQVRFAAEGQDPNDVARFLDLGFPMAVLLLNTESRWWARALVFGYLPLGLAGVLLTASRSGFLTAAVAFAGGGLLLLRRHPRQVLGGLMSVMVPLGIFLLFAPPDTIARIATIPAQLGGGDLNQRINIWAAGWQAFVHAPLSGSGAGSFVAAARLAQFDTAHNTALSLAVEGGLVALALSLGIVVAAMDSALRLRGPARIGFGTLLVVWMMTSLAATVEGSRSTWFLLALVSVAGRLAVEAPVAMSRQFETNAPTIRGLESTETIA